MRLKFGMIVTDGRGKLGGHVLSKNRAGAYARTKVTPSNPQTTAQSQARALFAFISQSWSGLTDTVRNGWNSAVAEWQKTDIFGDLRQPSGKALFQRLNNQAQSAGFPPVTSAPARMEMVSGVVQSVVVAVGAGTISLNGLADSGVARVMLFATPVLSDGTTFVKNKLSLIETFVDDAVVPADTFDSFELKFGTPTAGANIYFGVKYVLSNGQASPMQILKATVTV